MKGYCLSYSVNYKKYSNRGVSDFDCMRYLFLFPLLLFPIPVFAESHLNNEIENPSEFVLAIDEHKYAIPYHVDAQVIAMAIDPELTSLLIGLENSKNSIFEIDLQYELINAEDNEFAILVNGYEADYEIISDSDSSKFSFHVPEFAEEVEIIGTHVIPEFPFGAIFGFVLLITIVTIIARTKPLIRL